MSIVPIVRCACGKRPQVKVTKFWGLKIECCGFVASQIFHRGVEGWNRHDGDVRMENP